MAKQQKVIIPIPKHYSVLEREAIGLEVVEFIRERTLKGKDKNNERFAGYSKSYQKSLDFQIAGKSKSRVDLTLSGDMLAALDVLSVGSHKLTLGYKAGDEINGRVEGNRLGSYGGEPNRKRARDFLGITKEDLAKILKKYPKDSEKAQRRAEQVLKANALSEDRSDGIETELEES